MTIDLALSEFEELWGQTQHPLNEEIVGVETLCATPPSLGSGSQWEMQLYAECSLFLQLSPVLDQSSQPEIPLKLKSQTIAKLHYAQETLRSNLNNPPTLTTLAQQLEISDSPVERLRQRTLRRGFRSLFGTTVVGYLTEQRLQ